MPRYDYRCLDCSVEFENFSKIAERLDQKCLRCGGRTKILISRPNLAIFQEGWYEDITDHPIYIQTPQQLREECDKHGAYSRYLRESTIWKTSPGESLDERTARERASGLDASSEAYFTPSSEGHSELL